MGGVGVHSCMDSSRTLKPELHHYVACEDDEEWYRCEFCGEKVYIGGNKTDLSRHEERCKHR